MIVECHTLTNAECHDDMRFQYSALEDFHAPSEGSLCLKSKLL